MFFVLRCIFWLSLVFAHLPEAQTGLKLADFMQNAGRHAEAFARQKAVEAPAAMAGLCAKRTEACLEAAAIMGGAAKPATPRKG